MRPALGLLCLLLALPAVAHKPSDSYLRLIVSGSELTGRWDIALRDLHALVTLDVDGDGAITWSEVQSRETVLVRAALEGLAVAADGRSCTLRVASLRVVDHVDGTYVALGLAGGCPTAPRALRVDYDFLFALDPSHRGLLNLRFRGSRSAVLSPSGRTAEFTRAGTGLGRLFLQYFREGVGHIWKGMDHFLFLACLLLPAVLRREQGEWMAADNGWKAFVDVTRIVTAFTLAHALTLTAVSLEWLRLPLRWVEAAVAATILLAVVNNLRPLIRLERLWYVAFGFGLIHGVGYAGVLGGLGMPAAVLAVSLLGFNLGVEGGQILVAALLMPLAFSVRRQAWYRHGIVVPGSVLIGLMAALWLSLRLLNLRLEGWS